MISGGGPVGLTLAMDLAQRGVDVTLVEMRSAGEPTKVSCNHVSARTMETFRRLGIVSPVRNAGLPADYPHDVAFRTTASESRLPAFQFHVVPIAIPPKAAQTPGGQRQSRHTAS
jgi:2-polyprenyl-6-methoxyphenol hydroxylase-like FAD-dependent oxidoreductase